MICQDILKAFPVKLAQTKTIPLTAAVFMRAIVMSATILYIGSQSLIVCFGILTSLIHFFKHILIAKKVEKPARKASGRFFKEKAAKRTATDSQIWN